MDRIPVFSHSKYSFPLPDGHRFPMEKFAILKEKLAAKPIFEIKESQPITVDDACLAHDNSYVHNFQNGNLDKQQIRKTGLPWSFELVTRTFLECGGTLGAAIAALDSNIACNAAGGTHHAFPDYGSGFCLLNDLAITAIYLVENGYCDHVCIIDMDVHQGDGTAKICQEHPQITTVSMHCEKNFPMNKEKSNFDISMPAESDDESILNQISSRLPGILDAVDPDFVLYDAGVDTHNLDSLGLFKMTDQGIFVRDQFILRECKKRKIPVATVIGGGYDQDLSVLVDRHMIVFEAAGSVFAGAPSA